MTQTEELEIRIKVNNLVLFAMMSPESIKRIAELKIVIKEAKDADIKIS